MKQIGLFIIGLTLSLFTSAQEPKDDFDTFLQKEVEGFDNFLSNANQEFINFMRDPWKEFEAKKPIERIIKPKPQQPIIFDKKNAPKDDTPTCLSIEEILDLSTKEQGQKAVAKINDVDDIVFEKPTLIVQKKKKPTVIVIKEKGNDKSVIVPEQEHQPSPSQKPIVKENKDTPSAEIKQEEPRIEKPELPTQPATTKPQPNRNTPLYTPQPNREALVYGGQTFYIPNQLKRECKLEGVKENQIADTYEHLLKADYQPLLKDCKQIANDLKLNDWGLFKLIQNIASNYTVQENESVLLQQFLLNELGYKAKVARKADENKLLLLVATDCTIYGYPYFKIENTTYYTLNSTQNSSFYLCEKDAPNAQNKIQMKVTHTPNFGGPMTTSTHQSKTSQTKVTISVPKALQEFYNSYPQCDYNIYFDADVNAEVASTLVSSLLPNIQGKTEKEAANILIDFVQNGFEYATDNEQFGYEKPFFVEELFCYPYSDCEDRSILYAYLVRKLLDLDVVLLKYPNHLATAVRFNSNVDGDYVMVAGEKYTVCDPTYFNASIGMAMPQFKKTAAKVLKY